MTISFKHDAMPLLRIALPLAVNGIVQSGVYFFETLFFAHVNEKTLAASALVGWLFGTIAVILFGTLSSINILIAHKHGAKNEVAIAGIVRDGIVMALILLIPAFLLLWNMSPIFLLFGQPQSIVILAQSYLHALAWGLLPNFILMAILEMILGLGNTRTIMIFTAFEVPLVILNSYILIFGKWGFPALGIAGAGWGMTLTYWLTMFILIFIVMTKASYRKYFSHIFNFKTKSYLLELFRIGLPMGIMYCFEVGFFFALTLIMGSIDSTILAANQIVLQYLGLLMSTMFSIAQAITVRMGHLLGAKEFQSAQRAHQVGIIISITFMSVVAIFYWFCPTLLIAVDFNIHDPVNFPIINMIKEFLFIAAFFQLFEAVRVAFFGSLRSLKDTNFTLLTSIISFWLIALPLGYWLIFNTPLGPKGLWLAMVLSAVLSVCLLSWRYQIKIRRYATLI